MTAPHTFPQAALSEEDKGKDMGVAAASQPPLSHGFAAEPVPVSGKAGIANAEVKRLKSLARDHFRNARRLAARLVAAEMHIAELKKERQS